MMIMMMVVLVMFNVWLIVYMWTPAQGIFVWSLNRSKEVPSCASQLDIHIIYLNHIYACISTWYLNHMYLYLNHVYLDLSL